MLVYPSLQLVHVVQRGNVGRRAAAHRVRDVREHGLAHCAAHDVGRVDGFVDAALAAAARARLALADAVALVCSAERRVGGGLMEQKCIYKTSEVPPFNAFLA